MTQIVSVSATTAGYVTEGLRPSARISGPAQTQETTQAQVTEARKADNIRHSQLTGIVGPAAVAVFFLTAGERGRLLQQTTLRQAEEAYSAIGDEVEETADKHSEENADEQASEGDDDEEFSEQQSEILALPAPAEMS